VLGSFLLGVLLSSLGAACIVTGIAIGVVDAFRPPTTSLELGVKDAIKIGELVRDILKAFGKLKAPAQFLAVGIALLAGGIALLYARPF
jgi:hypothetical protein